VATITLLRLPKGCGIYFTLQPFCSRYFVYFVLTNGAAGSADYTTTNVTVTVPVATTGTVSVPTTADTIDEVTKL
jgi:hypothetical protein